METAEQIERFHKMSYLERHWRTYQGVMCLKGYARWKAGNIILWSMAIGIGVGIFGILIMASIVFLPFMVFLKADYPPLFVITSLTDLAFHAFCAVIFVLIAPEITLSVYNGLRESLEKLTREEGTFWCGEFSNDD